jgi:hypothetical protein
MKAQYYPTQFIPNFCKFFPLRSKEFPQHFCSWTSSTNVLSELDINFTTEHGNSYPFTFNNYFKTTWASKSGPGSSVGIVSGYGLGDRAIEVRSLAKMKDFSSNLCVQTGFGTHPASCTMGTGGRSPGLKRCRGVTLATHPHLVPRSWMMGRYTSSPPKRLRGV